MKRRLDINKHANQFEQGKQLGERLVEILPVTQRHHDSICLSGKFVPGRQLNVFLE